MSSRRHWYGLANGTNLEVDPVGRQVCLLLDEAVACTAGLEMWEEDVDQSICG